MLNITWILDLDPFTGMNRFEMINKGIWSDFQMKKASVMRKALEKEDDTLFLDADILLLNKIVLPINSVYSVITLGVSPHYINKKDTDKYGYYNGGMLWSKDPKIEEKWVNFTKTSRYFDQASIEDLVDDSKGNYFEFGEEYNFSWWRVDQSDQSPEQIIANLSTKESSIYYKDKPLRCVHTHFDTIRTIISNFNKVIIQNLIKCGDYKSTLIINRMLNDTWQLTVPKQPLKGFWKHKNDSFRELMLLMQKHNTDLSLELNTHSGHCWLKPNVLLYDRPTDEWFSQEIRNSILILLGNGSVDVEGKDKCLEGKKVLPWIFWPRRPFLLETFINNIGILGWNDRTVESLFIGNYENNTQKMFRTGTDWNSVVQVYHCTGSETHKFTQEEYLQTVRNSKYGLCLRGYGSKCHREVELMAFGTVPIVAIGVNMDSYMDKLEENVHYFRVKSPEEFRQKVQDTTKEKWEQMSMACFQWYNKNIHSKNCWNTMISNILTS